MDALCLAVDDLAWTTERLFRGALERTKDIASSDARVRDLPLQAEIPLTGVVVDFARAHTHDQTVEMLNDVAIVLSDRRVERSPSTTRKRMVA